jgi:hypothetical protein
MSDKRWINIERIYAGKDGVSHFEDLWLPLEERLDHPSPTIVGESIGFIGELPATAVSWRVTPPGGDHDYHWSPGRALQFTLVGLLELEVGGEGGERRRFGPGSALMLDEQGEGQGHRSIEIEPRVTLNVYLDPDLDLSPYRIPKPEGA